MTREVIITKAEGMTNKDATTLVQRCVRYDCGIFFEQGNRTVNAKSLMGVISMGLKKGAKFTVRAEGKDEEAALYDICSLIERGFAL